MKKSLLCSAIFASVTLVYAADNTVTKVPSAIPWNQIGSKAGADYKGDGLGVTLTEAGARLCCVFQQLGGEATSGGLWVTSTVTNTMSDRFCVKAMEVGRKDAEPNIRLDDLGTVSIDGQSVCFSRPGLKERYSVSVDGVRQDFIVEQAPATVGAQPGQPSPRSEGDLAVKLAVAGARVEAAPYGAQLVLENSGRKIAYSRLRVTDATGKALAARMEVCQAGDEVTRLSFRDPLGHDFEENLLVSTPAPRSATLCVVVNDADAVYPVHIDPTFSDANWISLGGVPGANSYVFAAVVDGSGNLIIGGDFTAAGDATANYIALWNGSSWSALGSGMNSDVYALAVSGSTLYAGGTFTMAGGNAVNYIAQWNGTNWSALGSGISGAGTDGNGPYIAALASLDGTLYAGGDFTTAGGGGANYIAQWNGSSWSALGSGLNDAVGALALSVGVLYAGGAFTTAGGNTVNCIAQWNGSTWSALGSGMNDVVYALTVSGGALYAGGYFTTAGGNAANYIAQWDGSAWLPLGSGMDSYVYALTAVDETLYAGGDFQNAGSNAANYIAQWNGSGWSATGSGIDGEVLALTFSGSALYAGGQFTSAGGLAANYIAQWNGTSWSPLGTGMNGPVVALAVSGSTLYAAGEFTTAGGTTAYSVAQWNGSNWSALGTGLYGPGLVDGPVYALAASGSTLYMGGRFFYIYYGGEYDDYSGIAQWNGSNWLALGSGIGSPANGESVEALAVTGGTLYAGGSFNSCVAQWNGSSWSTLGSGISGAGNDGNGPYVAALASVDGTLYAGGDFTAAGGSPANYIAQWNGSNWLALGSGMSGGVNALAASANTLYAGGNFTTAGGKVSGYAAMASLPVPLAIVTANAAFGFTNGVFGFDVSGPFGTNVVIQGSSNLQTWIPLQTNLLGSGLLYFSDLKSPVNRQRLYRAALSP